MPPNSPHPPLLSVQGPIPCPPSPRCCWAGKSYWHLLLLSLRGPRHALTLRVAAFPQPPLLRVSASSENGGEKTCLSAAVRNTSKCTCEGRWCMRTFHIPPLATTVCDASWTRCSLSSMPKTCGVVACTRFGSCSHSQEDSDGLVDVLPTDFCEPKVTPPLPSTKGNEHGLALR